ncbi:hypothetical protein PSN45_004216, partial [Yamadazyma tenuis]|uniref:uncharacterized protein n=1 Tax=Candida tenuis TaxID=2315449 RepID=UPI0027A8E5C3
MIKAIEEEYVGTNKVLIITGVKERAINKNVALTFFVMGDKVVTVIRAPSVHRSKEVSFTHLFADMFKKMDIPITAEKVRTSGQRLTGDCGPLKRSADKEGMAGAIFHGVGEGRICFMEAAAIAKRKDLEVKPLTKEEVFE